ncbi:MAG: pyridoxamine 5'-phosphate oxidase family protein [Myxococcota bacterium]
MPIPWSEFEAREPELAATSRRLLYPIGPKGPGLGFLATTRADGGPRVHPVCPALYADGLYVFVMPGSPKRFDLERDGRYALHAYPAEKDDESFYCIGRALAVSDPGLRERAIPSFTHHVKPEEALFELRLHRVLHTVWLNARQPGTKPVYHRWQA